MGTRGLIGYRINDTVVAQYQQYDSYPSGVGNDFLRDVRELVQDRSRVLELIYDIHVIHDADAKVPADVRMVLEANGYTDNPNNYKPEDMTWYFALRNNQGELKKTLESGYIINDPDFANDALFCEWAYIWDLIRMEVHVYKGYEPQYAIVVENPIPFGALHHVGRFKDIDLPTHFDDNQFSPPEE